MKNNVVSMSRSMIENLTKAARLSERKRKNYNFHGSEDDPCHRILNAIEPDSYVRPHRHLDETKDETLVVVAGALLCLIFDDSGTMTESISMAAGSPIFGVNIPHGTWHTFIALEAGTVFFEAKAGPYKSLVDAEKADWAPDDNTPDAEAYLAFLRQQCE